MSLLASPPPKRPIKQRGRLRTKNAGGAHSLLAQGESQIWLTGGALFFCLAMIVGLLLLVITQGAPTFWPARVVQIETRGGKTLVGEVSRTEQYSPAARNYEEEAPQQFAEAQAKVEAKGGVTRRRLIRTENFDITGSHFQWVSDFAVQNETLPEWMVVFERMEDGRLYGEPVGFVQEGQRTEMEAEYAWDFFRMYHAESRQRLKQADRLIRRDLGQINAERDDMNLAIRRAELRYGEASAEVGRLRSKQQSLEVKWLERAAEIQSRIDKLKQENDGYRLLVQVATGQTVEVALDNIVRAYPANQLGFGGKLEVYLDRWWEFLSQEPRNNNTEGGVFPAIFGTVSMTLIMSLLVAPFGVLAALYLREYAKSGIVVSLIRIAINNLAGVPSIVFGVFGFGFFVYQVGAYVDGGPPNARLPVLPPPAWFGLLGLLAVVAVAAFACGIYGMSSRAAEASFAKRWLGRGALVLWLVASALVVGLLATTPFFHGFFRESLQDNNPTFGTGGILWASLTLSLLTLPVVIVATEEALAAVPNSMREGSYACGAGKWQTIRRIVLPHAMPGIMTGMILAMSRGAGEVAPLMLVGALAKAPSLPVDTQFPFVHAQRSFMHLALQIFDLGFHSPNSEAAKPTVFTTALLLIAIVAVLNIAAVWLRARLRKQFRTGQF
jgi:ABC-type phosphate transport system permease subunit